MQLNITSTDLQTLLTLYNQEIENLKGKLLNGESWENLKPTRNTITELAIAIQKSHGFNVAAAGSTRLDLLTSAKTDKSDDEIVGDDN